MELFTFSVMPDRQELIYLPGNGTTVTLTDAGAVPSLARVERAVLVARLRMWADLIEADQ